MTTRPARGRAVLTLLSVAAGCSPRGASHTSLETASGATLTKEVMGPVVTSSSRCHVDREETLAVRLRARERRPRSRV